MARSIKKLGPLEKLAAGINRRSTKAPKGRTFEEATPTKRREARDKYGSKLKAPPGIAKTKKRGPGSGILARARKAQIDRAIRKSGG